MFRSMGFPTDMFPVLFCIPRTAGWLAHWVREDGKGAACSFVWVVRLCAFVCARARLCAGCVGCVDCVRCVRLCACVKVRVFVWVVRVVCLFVLSNCPAFGCMVGRELLLQP